MNKIYICTHDKSMIIATVKNKQTNKTIPKRVGLTILQIYIATDKSLALQWMDNFDCYKTARA